MTFGSLRLRSLSRTHRPELLTYAAGDFLGETRLLDRTACSAKQVALENSLLNNTACSTSDSSAGGSSGSQPVFAMVAHEWTFPHIYPTSSSTESVRPPRASLLQVDRSGTLSSIPTNPRSL